MYSGKRSLMCQISGLTVSVDTVGMVRLLLYRCYCSESNFIDCWRLSIPLIRHLGTRKVTIVFRTGYVQIYLNETTLCYIYLYQRNRET